MSAVRTYNLTFRGVTVSAAQDLLAAYCGANMAIEIVGYKVSPANPTIEIRAVSIKHLPATVTTGSGGTSITPQKDTPTDAAATFTARANDTTAATTSGTADYADADAWNETNGVQWLYPAGSRPTAKPSEALVLSLDAAPSSGIAVSGWMKIRELF
jgi:hypothetical protein